MMGNNKPEWLSTLYRKRTVAKEYIKERFNGENFLNWHALCVPDLDNPKIVYLPIPKAGNTTIRWVISNAMKIDPKTISNIHNDPRLVIAPQVEIIPKLDPNAFLFTIIRNPAARIFSAYQNKLVDQKKSFGPARRLGVNKSDSFERFLEKCLDVPHRYLDSHFKSQSHLLHYGQKNSNLQIFKI